MIRYAAFALAVIVWAGALHAHEGVHEQIAKVTARIQLDPRNARLFLQRGELHRVHRNWRSATRDYDRAGRLDPALAAVDLARGLLLLDRGRGAQALAPLRRYVHARGDDNRGLIALARAHVMAGESSGAADAYAAVLALTPQPDPEWILEHARALVAAGRPRAALEQLDAMMVRLGPVAALQLAAIDIDLSLGHTDDALRRVARAEAQAARKETWLARRGDILLRAGRTAEARAAYRSALDAIASLPEERRFTRAHRELEERMRAALGVPFPD